MRPTSIRDERSSDGSAVFAVLADAFATDSEAKLVDELRGATQPQISLVAESEGQVAGHILFTPVEITARSASHRGMGLAPLAVRTDHQRRGVGSALVRAGLSRCRKLGEGLVVVLGSPDYYPRFGFRPAWERSLYFQRPGPNPSFMALELLPNALPEGGGEVRYHPAIMAL